MLYLQLFPASSAPGPHQGPALDPLGAYSAPRPPAVFGTICYTLDFSDIIAIYFLKYEISPGVLYEIWDNLPP